MEGVFGLLKRRGPKLLKLREEERLEHQMESWKNCISNAIVLG